MTRTNIRTRAAVAVLAASLALLTCTACTEGTEARDPKPTTANEAPSKNAEVEQAAAQEQLLDELGALDPKKAKDDCSALKMIGEMNTLAQQLDPETVGTTLDDRLEQTAGYFERLTKLAKDPAEQAAWAKVDASARAVQEKLAQYGGEAMNEAVLTALGEYQASYQEAAEKNGDAIEERCGIDLAELFGIPQEKK